MNGVVLNDLMVAYGQAAWPEYQGERIWVDWAQYLPGAPIFALVEGECPRMCLLVEPEECHGRG